MSNSEGNRIKKTAAACSRQSCDGCEIEGELLCIHKPADVVDFCVLAIGWMIPFFAGMIIGKFWIGLSIWLGLAALFFGYFEALLLCCHCPHYAEKGFFLKCHANWGFPKIPRLNPRPMNRIEKTAFLIYASVLFLYNVPFFVISRQWLLLLINTWALFVWVWTLWRTQCVRCYNLGCPANRVPEYVRKVFFENYPEFSKAWKGKS